MENDHEHVFDSTCLKASSVASCDGKLVAPLRVAHVGHKPVVQCIA